MTRIRRGRPSRTADPTRGEVPARRVVVRQGVSMAGAGERANGRSRKSVAATASVEIPQRRIVLKQGVSLAAYRKALAAEVAQDGAAPASDANARPLRPAVSMHPDYAPPARRIVVREGQMAAYLAALASAEAVREDLAHATAEMSVSGAGTGTAHDPDVPAQAAAAELRPARRKRVAGSPRAPWLPALARQLPATGALPLARDAAPVVVPVLTYDGEPPAPSKRPGRRPVTATKKRRTKGAQAGGSARRGRKPRKPGVLSAGARRRTVAPQ